MIMTVIMNMIILMIMMAMITMMKMTIDNNSIVAGLKLLSQGKNCDSFLCSAQGNNIVDKEVE